MVGIREACNNTRQGCVNSKTMIYVTCKSYKWHNWRRILWSWPMGIIVPGLIKKLLPCDRPSSTSSLDQLSTPFVLSIIANVGFSDLVKSVPMHLSISYYYFTQGVWFFICGAISPLSISLAPLFMYYNCIARLSHELIGCRCFYPCIDDGGLFCMWRISEGIILLGLTSWCKCSICHTMLDT